MKKSLLTLLCIFAATSFAVAQSKIGQKGENGLYGNIKSFKQCNVKATSQFGNVVTSDTTYTCESQYNMGGEEIGFHSWSPTEELVVVYELREDGTRMHGQRYCNSVLEAEFWYDEKGLLKRKWIITGILKGKKVDIRYAYDEFGKLLTDTTYDANGELEFLNTYQYNADSLLEKRVIHNAERSVLSTTTYYYDESKRVTKEVRENVRVNSKDSTEITYDNKGRILKTVRSFSHRVIENIYSYLDVGRDESTTMVETITTPKGQTIRYIGYEYIYDAHGNWTKKIIYNVNTENEIKDAKQVLFREIVYY